MATQPTTVAVIGVNSGISGSGVRRVLITPIASSASGQGLPKSQIIEKVLLKTAAKAGTKKEKIFTLRNINTSKMVSCEDLKKEIKKQLSEEVIDWEEFDVGYAEGSKVVNIRKEDMAEVWKEIAKQGDKIKLWCDGLKKSSDGRRRSKRRRSDDEDEFEDDVDSSKKTAQQEREETIKRYLDILKKKHGVKYTTMQYNLWAEMKIGGTHSDLDSPPVNSMFRRAGGATSSAKKNSSSPEMAQALTQAATQVSAAILLPLTPLNLRKSLNR